jgi:chromosome partitioning protein
MRLQSLQRNTSTKGFSPMAGSLPTEIMTPLQCSIAEKYSKVFDHANPADSFVITDDFVSAGRISGAKSIPISRLKIGSFHMVEGKRLQVNSSAERYQRELAYLLSIL